VTVEEIVDELDARVTVVLPSWVVTAIAVVPRGAYPSYAHGYYERDNQFYQAWDRISRDRQDFEDWIENHIHQAGSFAEHLTLVGTEMEGDV
jgi:glutaconate CoA-transferase, subunit A